MTSTTLAEIRDSKAQATVTQSPPSLSASNWELAQRQARALAASDLVPQQFRNNVPNCLIALEMANRMGASALMVCQNLFLVHGNPGWSSKFLIACFNQSGRFSSLRYEWNEDRSGCRAWAVEKSTNERIDGPKVTLEMAKAEGWSTKNGSKWKTMPELMLMYRAAAFLIRTYAPEISMGLSTDDELRDVVNAAPPKAVTLASIIADTPAPNADPDIDSDTGETSAPIAPPPPTEGQANVTYAQLADDMAAVKTAQEADAVLARAKHLPEDQQQELRTLSDWRGGLGYA